MVPTTVFSDIVEIIANSSTSTVIGTGTIVKKNLVITNHHVLEGMTDIVIRYDGIKKTARVVHIDIDNDLALLKTDTGNLEPVSLKDTFSGFGIGYGYLDGVKHKSRKGQYTVQGAHVIYTSTLYRGLSGGPILDITTKKTVAIISAIARDSDTCSDVLSIAIPASIVLKFINEKPSSTPINSWGTPSLDMSETLPIFILR